MSKKSIKGPLMLLMAAAIWGFAFVAQSTAMDRVGPFTFQAVRSLLGSLILLPVIAIKDKILLPKGKKQENEIDKGNKRTVTLLTGGILCGIALAVGSDCHRAHILGAYEKAEILFDKYGIDVDKFWKL